MNKTYIISISRYRREHRKWGFKINAGDEVYVTRCGKNPILMMTMPKEQYDVFKYALNSSPRPISDSLKKLLNSEAPWVQTGI
jgi:hypothetical protein